MQFALKELINETFYCVQADEFARHTLWKEFQAENGLGPANKSKWSDYSVGYSQHIGDIAGRPIVLSLSFSTVNKQTIMFYNCCSLLADWGMAEDWLVKNVPAMSPANRRHCDAQNFHNCLIDIGRQDSDKFDGDITAMVYDV